MIEVKSSMIEAVKWENDELTLYFQSGRKYTYFDVPEEIYKEFLDASSKGVFFLDSIKDCYDYIKVR